MIENTVLDFLNRILPAPAYMEIPKSPPAKMVIIERTGGSVKNHINFSTFAIQSYGKSLLEAAELNELVKDAMLDGMNGITVLGEIVSVSLNSDYNFTDPTTKRYRYQAVFDIVHY